MFPKSLSYFFFCCFLFLFSFEAKEYCTEYVDVKTNDTCWQVATSQGISVDQLKSFNPSNLNCDQLWVGQKICIKTSSSTPKCTKTYTVVSEDYCYKVWTANGLTEDQLKELNEQLNCDKLAVGDVLCVSIESTASTSTTDKPKDDHTPIETKKYCTEYVEVKANDSCWKIATSFGISVDQLNNFNPSKLNCDQLWVGQKICIKTSSSDPKCTKTYNVVSGDYCHRIWTANGLTEYQFKELNEQLNCDKLAVGDVLCVSIDFMASTSTTDKPKDDHPPLPLVEKPQTCFEFTEIQHNDSCESVAFSYNLNLTTLQENYDCANLKVGDTICVSPERKTCQYRYTVREFDTCSSIRNVFKVNSTEIEGLNRDVSCKDGLEEGRSLCVWSVHDRELADVTCVKTKEINEESSCYELSRSSSLPIDFFRFLNPHLNCSNRIASNTTICTASKTTPICAAIRSVPSNTSCSELAAYYSMSFPTLMLLNPTLRCDKLAETEQVCIGRGHFEAEECSDTLKLAPGIDTCDGVIRATGLLKEQIEELNPGLNCSEPSPLEWGMLVCISSLGMETHAAQNLVVAQLCDLIPNLNSTYRNYQKNPNEENTFAMNTLMITSLLRPSVNSKVKTLYRLDKNFRSIIDHQHPLPREVYCTRAKSSTFAVEIKNCFCGSEELLIYCHALAFESYKKQDESSLNSTEFQQRSKRALVGCDLSHPLSGNSKREKLQSFGGFCFGGGCSIPAGFLTFKMEANLCAPILDITQETVEFCGDKDNDCQKISSTNVLALKHLGERGLEGKLSMCVTDGDIIERILKVGAGICWDIVRAEYKWFVGLVDVGTAIQLILVKVSGGAVIKAHDMMHPKMCDYGSIECEDYCILKDYEWENGRAYGYIKLNLLELFGWSGIPLVDKKIDRPRKLGCQAGSEAAVVLRNDRTCKNIEDRDVWRRCWSGDDRDTTFELMEDFIKGFHFVPWSRTLFVCEFVTRDSNTGQKIGFDVYGGTSSNQGKKTFYYAVRNDGVYFGLEKFKEDTLVKAWNEPCEGEEEEGGSDSRREPTGRSSVPAARCGKRIVGYYTGWGDREITENQLQMLTHVIFAFVAMYHDGSIRFGPVSAEDSGPDATAKAKRRFLDMKEKARSVRSGVHILFAVGGWDNSQHFSSMASDAGRRKVFIDSVAAFIDEHGIDGVDIDWEYPDMKGADKENHVTLLRELREKLTSLQREIWGIV